jgi:hypothetical protein
VFSNRQISVFDSFSGSDILRTLHFNQRPNLVQVHINKCITPLIITPENILALDMRQSRGRNRLCGS